MSKKIVFNVDLEGNVKISKLEGYGSSCLETTKLLERKLGNVDEGSRKMTDEYNKEIETHKSLKASH